MKDHKKMMRQTAVILIAFIITGFIFATFTHAAFPNPTVSIINPKPGTFSSPTVVSLRPTTTDFKVQVKVWDDVAIVSVGVQYSSDKITWLPVTPISAALNANYPYDAANSTYGVYEAFIPGLTAGNTYYLRAMATSADGTGYSSDGRTMVDANNDARYICIKVLASKTGTGMLLGRDASSQLCSDCHEKTVSHSSGTTDTGYGNWQLVCLECHTPHTTKNIYLIKETITTPNSGNKPVVLWNTSGDAAYSYVVAVSGAATQGVCQVCHTQTTGSGTSRWRNTGNGESPAHYGGGSTQRCTACHSHTAGFKGSCVSCHGNPPVNDSTLINSSTTFGPSGRASQFPGGGSGAHNIHYNTKGYGCDLCHNGGGPSGGHNKTTSPALVHIGYNLFGGTYVSGSYTAPDFSAVNYDLASGNAGTTVTISGTQRICSNFYCHSRGASSSIFTGTNAPYQSAIWEGTLNNSCSGCHGNDGTSAFTVSTGSHTKHVVASGYGCADCHTATVSANRTISNQSNHVNNLVNIAFEAIRHISGTYNGSASPMTKAPGSPYGLCTNITCHNDGRPVWTGGAGVGNTNQWGTAGGCNNCHGNTTYPSDYRMAAPLYDSTTVVSPGKPNAHRPHITAGTVSSGETQCLHCHNSTTTSNTTVTGSPPHINTAYTVSGGTYANGNNVSVNIAVAPGWTYSGQPAVSACATVSCHPTGTTTAANSSTTIYWHDKDSSNYQCEDCHSINLTANASYHHSMNSTTYTPNPTAESDYPTAIPQGDWSAGTNPASRKCLMCHVKHNIFSNRMNSNGALTAPRAMNLRTAIGTAPTAAANYTNSDYVNSGIYGICITCHNAELTKDNNASPRVKAETGSTKTVAVTGANYSASAHQYNAATTMKTGGAAFNSNCSKCHNAKNGEGTTTFQNVGDASRPRQFGTHDSSAKRLVSALGGTLTENYEEAFCFRCHSKQADAIGGTKKPAANNDWYGSYTTMTAASQDIYTVFQYGGLSSTTTTNTLYLKPSGQETPAEPMPNAHASDTTTFGTNVLFLKNVAQEAPSEPMSNAYILASGTYDVTTYVGTSMTPVPGSSAVTASQATVNATTRYDRVSQLISPPLASGFTWANATAGFVLNLYQRESNAAANCLPRPALYQWLTTDAIGTTFKTVANGTEQTAAAYTSTATNITTSSAVTFLTNQKILLELEIIENAPTAAYTCDQQYGGAIGTAASYLQLANIGGNMPEFTYTAPAIGGGTWVGRTMSPNAPTSANETVTTGSVAVSTGAQLWRMASFTSPAIATATTTTAAAWTINIADSESDALANAYVRYRIYVWNADDTKGADIVPWTTWGTEMGTATANQAITTPTGAAVALAVGDKIVVDLEAETVNVATGGNYILNYIFGSTNQSNVVMPNNITFTYASPLPGVSHRVGSYSGLHKPSPTDETLAYISANKHVECGDCHNVHAAGVTKHTTGTANTNLVSNVLKGVSGAIATFSGTNWTAPTYTLGTATKEYEICFKCHSSANTNPSGWNSQNTSWTVTTGSDAWTDVGLEFSTGNKSGHPIATGLNNYPNSATPKALTAAQMKAPWNVNMGTQTMYCTDCHETDSTASKGPHGSAVKWMLKGTDTNWPYTTNAGNGGSSGTLVVLNTTTPDGEANFCRNCHVLAGFVPHNTSSHNNTPCVACHIRVPHGGKIGRLMAAATATANMPARYWANGASPAMNQIALTGFQKAATYQELHCGSATGTYGSCSWHSSYTTNTNLERW